MQSNHATLHLSSLYRVDEGIPNIVAIGVPTLKSLNKARGKLEAAKIPHYAWHEPDPLKIGDEWLSNQFTAITTAPIRGEQRLALENYRVYSTPRVLMASTSASKAESTGPIPVGCANGEGTEASV